MKIYYFIAPLIAVLVIGIMGIYAPVFTINIFTPSSTYKIKKDIAYGPLTRQKLDIYIPKTVAPAGGWPVVVFFPGGSWVRGDRAIYRFVGEALASHGVLTLIADYRLYPDVRYPDFLIDCANALAFGMTEASKLGGNQKRLFVMGHSAGAYNAAMLALDPRWLKSTGHNLSELAGWIGLAGPYDFYPITDHDVRPVFFYPNYPAHSQPIEYVSTDNPPAFLGFATNDDLVNPTRNTLGLAKRLHDAGVPVSLHPYARVNHINLIGTFSHPIRWLAPALEDTLIFINDPKNNLSH